MVSLLVRLVLCVVDLDAISFEVTAAEEGRSVQCHRGDTVGVTQPFRPVSRTRPP